MTKICVKHGDFSSLAENYSKYRQSYSHEILSALLNFVEKPVQFIDFVDIGAGTGIWTRMVAEQGCRSVTIIEPNDEMRFYGKKDSRGLPIIWKKGTGEKSGLENQSCDLLTTASSLHWIDLNKGICEFHRILREGGAFAAIWNPRFIEDNPFLMEIEKKLYEMAPHIKRKSSGRSEIATNTGLKLEQSKLFDNITYHEEKNVILLSPDQYIGAWWSVNDIQVQAGHEIFGKFIKYIEEKIKHLNHIETTYLTVAWFAKKI